MRKLMTMLCLMMVLFLVPTEPVVVKAATGSVTMEQEVSMQDSGETGNTEAETTETPEIPDIPEEPVATAEMSVTVNNQGDEKKVNFQWKSVQDAKNYVILQKTEEGWIPVLSTDKASAPVSLKQYGEENCYKVQALDAAETVSMESKEITVLIPRKAAELRTTAYSRTKVKLAWENAEDANAWEIYEKEENGKYRLVKTVNKEEASLPVKDNSVYSFKVVPLFKSEFGTLKGKESRITFRNKEFVSISHQKYTYEEMEGDIDQLCKKYSEYVSCDVIGYSRQGREIYDVILGNPDAEKTIVVVSTLHAREYIATVVCMKQLEFYLLNYNRKVDGKKVSEVFENCNVHYVMMANPDGVTMSQNGKIRWKANAAGVDLNHNFPCGFEVNGRAKKGTYSGKKALSEPETRALDGLIKELKTTQEIAVINYHAMGRIVFGSYGGKDKTLRKQITRMYQIARTTTGYADAGGYSNGKGNGNYREYVMYDQKLPSITIEVGKVSCPVPKSQYATEFNLNKLVVLREAAWFA